MACRHWVLVGTEAAEADVSARDSLAAWVYEYDAKA